MKLCKIRLLVNNQYLEILYMFKVLINKYIENEDEMNE